VIHITFVSLFLFDNVFVITLCRANKASTVESPCLKPSCASEPVYEELDRIITDDEILVAISNLKRSKSHGIDGLLNEYLIEYRDLLLPLLNKLIVRNPSNMFPCCLL
jgi:hypothetical protein